MLNPLYTEQRKRQQIEAKIVLKVARKELYWEARNIAIYYPKRIVSDGLT